MHWQQSVRQIIWIVILHCVCLTAAYASTEEAAVVAAYKNWCSAIGTAKGNAEAITAFYAPDATLLPTLSPEVLFNREGGGKKAYFEGLTSKTDIRCVPEKLYTHLYGDIAVNAGFYEFRFKDGSGHLQKVPARFTFVYENKDGHWLIVSHHSSVVPAH
jgi:uncharacterized protein (TIGR02246 family)